MLRSASTKLKITRDKNNVIRYYSGSRALRTCRYKLTGAVFVDTSIHNNNAGGINSARWNVPKGSRLIKTIKWTSLGNAAKSGMGGLSKKGAGNGWNAGAFSKYPRKGNTQIQFRCATNNHIMIGFSKGNSHNSYTDIDCVSPHLRLPCTVERFGAWLRSLWHDMSYVYRQRTATAERSVSTSAAATCTTDHASIRKPCSSKSAEAHTLTTT